MTIISNIFAEAKYAAINAELDFITEHGEPGYCGFAWVDIYVDRINSKEAKELIAAGFTKSYNKPKCLTLWNPGGSSTQSMDIKECGSLAFAKVFKKYGFRTYADSRAD